MSAAVCYLPLLAQKDCEIIIPRVRGATKNAKRDAASRGSSGSRNEGLQIFGEAGKNRLAVEKLLNNRWPVSA